MTDGPKCQSSSACQGQKRQQKCRLQQAWKTQLDWQDMMIAKQAVLIRLLTITLLHQLQCDLDQQ